MNKKLRIAGIIGALIVSALILTSPSSPPPIPEPTEQRNETIQILATGLKRPWAIEFAGEKIFVTEKSGNIRIIQDGVLLDEPLGTFRAASVFGGGLLGIAAHPDFNTNGFLYAYYTYSEDNLLQNKIVRITESDNKILDVITIIDGIPGSQFYNGGVIKFGPDGKLYVATGLSSEFSHEAQDKASLGGKILRLNDDGTIPGDNPFSNSPVFSMGHRDVQGMAWDNNGNLYISELGPSKNDEINLVRAGSNYGWPEQECRGERFANPVMCYDPAIEPGGIVFYNGDKLEYRDRLIMATLRGTNLFSLDIKDDGISSQKGILSGLGRIRDVTQGPDGYLYIITSNTDGKGFPDKNDDKLVRILR